MSNEDLAFHAHNWAITKASFEDAGALSTFYNLVATDKSEEFAEFVTAIEAKNYPIFGTLFHPEYQLLDFFP